MNVEPAGPAPGARRPLSRPRSGRLTGLSKPTASRSCPTRTAVLVVATGVSEVTRRNASLYEVTPPRVRRRTRRHAAGWWPRRRRPRPRRRKSELPPCDVRVTAGGVEPWFGSRTCLPQDPGLDPANPATGSLAAPSGRSTDDGPAAYALPRRRLARGGRSPASEASVGSRSRRNRREPRAVAD